MATSPRTAWSTCPTCLNVIANWGNPYDVADLLLVIADWGCTG